MKTFYPNTLPSPAVIATNSEPVSNYPDLPAWFAASKSAVLAQVEDNPPAVGAQITSMWRTSAGQSGDNPRTVIAVRQSLETPAELVDRQFDLIATDMRDYPPS